MFQSQQGRGYWRGKSRPPILGRARIPTEHVDLKAPFMKEIPFSTSVASRRSLKEDKGEINPDADEEGLVKVTTGHMNIQCQARR